ncbi:MAG: hypothetical protein R3D60_00630 [Paracoccaceae bacterium]
MSDARDPTAAERRQQLQTTRQARVGILRNPKTPPVPPVRRVALTGRFPSLRSSRRPPDDLRDRALRSVETYASTRRKPVETTPEGAVTAIDVGQLMASVSGLNDRKAGRAPFAAEYRADVPRAEKARPAFVPIPPDPEDTRPPDPMPEVDDLAPQPLPLVRMLAVAMWVSAAACLAVASLITLFP